MTQGVIAPYFEAFGARELGWTEHKFVGNAGTVWDTDAAAAAAEPEGEGGGKKLTVMIVGHADKIRMQVRSVGSDGKIWINSDSFLPLTLLGNTVEIFSEDPAALGSYRRFPATVEALGAIHFAPPEARSGKKGIAPQELYLELGLSGDKRQEQVEEGMGVKAGDTVLMDRPITRCFGEGAFSGAYLDNGLGCFVAAEVARAVAEKVQQGQPTLLDGVRCLFAFASHEEIGRFGSRVLAQELRPDVLIAVDVNHDYDTAPDKGKERYQPLQMGAGMTMCVGAVASEQLNAQIETAAQRLGVPVQRDVRGRDTGTDGMAGVLAAVDCAATSVGFPIRNMHTTSELAHTGDVLGCIGALVGWLEETAAAKVTAADFKAGHPRLDFAVAGPDNNTSSGAAGTSN